MITLIIAIALAFLTWKSMRYKGNNVALVWAIGAFILAIIVVPIVTDQLGASFQQDATVVAAASNDTAI